MLRSVAPSAPLPHMTTRILHARTHTHTYSQRRNSLDASLCTCHATGASPRSPRTCSLRVAKPTLQMESRSIGRALLAASGQVSVMNDTCTCVKFEVYLLQWYKSANTYATVPARWRWHEAGLKAFSAPLKARNLPQELWGH